MKSEPQALPRAEDGSGIITRRGEFGTVNQGESAPKDPGRIFGILVENPCNPYRRGWREIHRKVLHLYIAKTAKTEIFGSFAKMHK